MTKFASLLAVAGVALMTATSAFADQATQFAAPSTQLAAGQTPAFKSLGPSDESIRVQTSAGWVSYAPNSQGTVDQSGERLIRTGDGKLIVIPATFSANDSDVQVASQDAK